MENRFWIIWEFVFEFDSKFQENDRAKKKMSHKHHSVLNSFFIYSFFPIWYNNNHIDNDNIFISHFPKISLYCQFSSSAADLCWVMLQIITLLLPEK